MTFFLPLSLVSGVFIIVRVNEFLHVTLQSYFLSLQIIDRTVKDKMKLGAGGFSVSRL